MIEKEIRVKSNGELFGYTSELRSLTSGRGSSTMEPSHYGEVPKSVTEEVAAGEK